MANLIVTYDLKEPGKDYPRIAAAIKSLGTAVPIMLSVWYVKTALSAEQARNALLSTIDSRDVFLVINATDASGYGFTQQEWEGLQQLWLRAA